MSKASFELTEQFYEDMILVATELAEVESSLILHTDGLDALEKQLMKEHDAAYLAQYNKTSPEYWQRREAKADPRYIARIQAKAALTARRTILKAKYHILEMRYNEWRTRSANRRTGLS